MIELQVTEDAPIVLDVESSPRVRMTIAEQIINQGGAGLSDEVKQTLLAVIQNVAYTTPNGQDYYDALYAALYPPIELDYITAVYTQSGTVYDTDSLDSLKADLVVTAYYDDGTSEPVTAYTLSGTLTEGTSTITVSYGGKTTTFNVTVSSLLPSGYTQVPYLLSTVNADNNMSYINTGVSFTEGLTKATFIVDFEEVQKPTAYNKNQYPIGVRQTNTGSTNNIGCSVGILSTHTESIAFSGNPGAKTAITAYSRNKMTATWEADKVTLKINDGNPVESAQTTRNIWGYPISLCGLKHATSPNAGSPYPLNGKFYYAKVMQDDTTLIEVYPCVRDSDSKPGVYDIINNAFYAPYGNYITAPTE